MVHFQSSVLKILRLGTGKARFNSMLCKLSHHVLYFSHQKSEFGSQNVGKNTVLSWKSMLACLQDWKVETWHEWNYQQDIQQHCWMEYKQAWMLGHNIRPCQCTGKARPKTTYNLQDNPALFSRLCSSVFLVIDIHVQIPQLFGKMES